LGAGALLLALLAATSSWAQGMFYAEEQKDGRFYVFNIKENWERWKASGEVGTGLTRLGVGPNGETVYADNETALELFFFKHGIKEKVDRPKTPTSRVAWSPGRTTLTFDNAVVNLSNRIQIRYTHELPDDTVQLPGTEARGDSKGSFRIRRAKLKIDGWFYKSWMQYEFQANWPAVNTVGNPGALLEDANLNVDLTKGKRQFQVKIGQYKVPFGRQELTSSGSQQFVDRSQVSNQYARGRDIGAQLWGSLGGNAWEWRVGMFNGNGLTQVADNNTGKQINARLMWQLGGRNVGYSESDFESTDKPLFALAANYEHNDFHRVTTGNDLQDDVFGFDYSFKFKRFSSVAEYYVRERSPETGAEFNSDGYFVQAGFFLNKGRNWEIAARYGSFDPSDLVAGGDLREVRGGVNWFYANTRHNFKVQADFGQLENTATGVQAQELRIQTQFIF
jgi:phosphate-selective porin